MNGEKRSTQTTSEALAWYRSFFEAHGRIPTNPETEKLKGPTWRLRQRLGNTAGISRALGLTGPVPRAQYDNETLVNSLSKWVMSRGIDRAPTIADLDRAYQAGEDVITTHQTYYSRFGSWQNALAETGYFRFNWAASECVSFARRTSTDLPHLDLRRGIRKAVNPGVTPTLPDVESYYPSIRQLRARRLSWETWPNANSKEQKQRQIATVLSYGVLALATREGDLVEFEDANRYLHKEDRGPEYDRGLYASLNPHAKNEQAGYIWALDTIETLYDGLQNNSRKKPCLQLPLLGLVEAEEVMLPTFNPELSEILSKGDLAV